jgi:hypothetical protein
MRDKRAREKGKNEDEREGRKNVNVCEMKKKGRSFNVCVR